jgi:transcriptional regulator with XRE-family HTH domain
MDTGNPSRIALRLRALRKESGLSARGFGVCMGVDHSYVSRVEKGQRKPSAEYLQKVARHFNLDANKLLAYIGIKPPLLETREYLRKVGLNDKSADFFAERIEYELNKQRGKPREEPE